MTAIGCLVACLPDQNMAAARIVKGRLMWTTNYGSGGIGQGSPDIIKKTRAFHRGLAKEFAQMLVSKQEMTGAASSIPMNVG